MTLVDVKHLFQLLKFLLSFASFQYLIELFFCINSAIFLIAFAFTAVFLKSNEDTGRYLQQKLQYEEGRLLDAKGSGVMMGWETPLMARHAEVMCPAGCDVLNVQAAT